MTKNLLDDFIAEQAGLTSRSPEVLCLRDALIAAREYIVAAPTKTWRAERDRDEILALIRRAL